MTEATCNGCCDVDQVRDGCADTGAFIEGHCCKCVPALVCVSVLTSEDLTNDPDWSPYVAVDSVQAEWCGVTSPVARAYSGTLAVGSIEFDFRISFVKNEYNECWLAFESEALGYVGEYAVLAEMGGPYGETSVKRAECRAMEFQWDIDIYGVPATITIAPADTIKQRKRRIPTVCVYDRICVTVFDGYEETTVYACQDPEGTWVATFDAGEVILTREAGDDAVNVSVVSWFGYGETKQASCPQMYARWDFDGGEWIKIIGDTQARCTDCKFHCRCLCVTFTDSETSVSRDVVCAEAGYDGCDTSWTITLGGYEMTFSLQCTGCDPRVTKMRFEAPYGTTLISEPLQGIICPDQLSASWSFAIDEDTVGTVEVECVGCGGTCSLADLNVVTPCCPDRTTGIPVVLYATVESVTDCPQLDGQVITLLREGPFSANSYCWTGTLAVSLFGNTCIQRITLQCTSSDGETNVWRISQSNCDVATSPTNTATIVSCDPLELTITISGVGCCEGGVGASITLRVTE